MLSYEYQRKKKCLINWLADLKNEILINQIEELKEESGAEIPNEIISLLDSSNATNQSDLVIHTKTRKLLG